MPKEDRSDWVAVAPEFASSNDGNKIKPAVSAFTFFQRDVGNEVKAELVSLNDKFQVGEFTKAVRDRWNNLAAEEKTHYEDLAQKDRMRFASESHAADVAAIERRERLQREREVVLLDDEGGTQRSTRRQHAKKERKRERRAQKKFKNEARDSLEKADREEFLEGDESSDTFESESDTDSSDRPAKKKKAPKQLSQKQVDLRAQRQREKLEKEAIIAERQEDLRKEKAQQAKRRLEFLLKQSNIFSHFGQVKQDQAKYGVASAGKPKNEDSTNRRATIDDSQREEELEEADTHQATFLTAQPTTLGFGQMRQYQLEGLNWMIRLQENGVNGILADEVSSKCQCSIGTRRRNIMH